MDVDAKIKELKTEEQHSRNWPACFCCWPRNDYSAKFWGIVLVMMGGIWLLNILGVLATGSGLLWPILFICLGLFWLINGARNRV